MGFATTTLTLLFVFLAVTTNAQLNYEGNPLTENTEYTAEETQSVERSSRANQLEHTDTVLVNNAPQKLYPVYAKDAQPSAGKTVTINNTTVSIQKSIEIDPSRLQTSTFEARHLPDNAITYTIDTSKSDLYMQQQQQQQQQQPQQQNYLSNYALSTFLQSKTPEESKLALDYFLKSQELTEPVQSSSHQVVNNDVLQQGLPYQSSAVDFHQGQTNLQYAQVQQLQPNPGASFQPTSAPSYQSTQSPVFQQSPSSSFHSDPYVQTFQYPSNPSLQSQPMQIQSQPMQIQSQPAYPIQPSPGVVSEASMNSVSSPSQVPYPVPNSQEPLPAMYQPRVPMKYAPPRFSRNPRPMPRIRNKMPQQRIGPSFMYKSPPPILPQSYPLHPGMGKFKTPVEVIYTKPPGYRAPIRHASPRPYEEAMAWYPENNHLPTASQKDIFWSQLYAQSYDPHYYNYIAKTGKIKPHLYGKLHDHANEDEGILSEMIKGFKKHGLKNIMNPGFLLGMTIPALTLMLTALVQKRSLARADFGAPVVDQEKLDEYAAKLHKALQMFEDNKRTRTTRRRR